MTTREELDSQYCAITHALMDELPFQQPITLAEMADIVACMRVIIDELDEVIDSMTEHIDECDDEECITKLNQTIDVARKRRDRFKKHVGKYGLRLSKQQEHMEFLVAKKLGILTGE